MTFEGWNRLLSLSPSFPGEITYLIACAVFFALIIFPSYFFLRFFENKLVADMQARVGYSQTKLHGFFQALYEDAKAFSKRVSVDRSQMIYAVSQLVFCLILFSFTPFGPDLVFFENKNTAMSVYFLLFFFHLFLFLIFDHQKKIEYVYFFRRTLLMLLSMVIALVCHLLVLQQGEADTWSGIVEAQRSSPVFGNLFMKPTLFFAFFIYIIAGMISVGSHPFPENKRDLLAGHGFLKTISNGANFYYEWTWLYFAQTLFLSGWNGALLLGDSPLLILVSGAVKTTVLLVLIRVLTKTIPGMSTQQTIGFLYKYLAPCAVALLLLETVIGIF